MDIVMTLLAIMGVLLIAALASAGIRTAARWLSAPAQPALPDGVERIILKKTTFYSGLILVRYAWFLPEFGKYVAYKFIFECNRKYMLWSKKFVM